MEAVQGNAPDPVNAVTIWAVPDDALTVQGNVNIGSLAENITEKPTTENEVAPGRESLENIDHVKKNTMKREEAVKITSIVQENLALEEKVNQDQNEEMTLNHVEEQNGQEKRIWKCAKDPDTDPEPETDPDPDADPVNKRNKIHKKNKI